MQQLLIRVNLKTEALRRAEARIENGTATEKLKDLTKKL